MNSYGHKKHSTKAKRIGAEDCENEADNISSETTGAQSKTHTVRRRQRPTHSVNPSSLKVRSRERPRSIASNNQQSESRSEKAAKSKLFAPPHTQKRERGNSRPGRVYKPLVHAKNGMKLDALEYETGYGKPPEKHKFKKGKSGNPKGRPNGSKGLKNILKDALNQKIVSRANGVERKITTREGIIMRLIKKALDGDHNAIKLIMVKDEDFQLETLLEGEGAGGSASRSEEKLDAIDEAILAEFTRQLLERGD